MHPTAAEADPDDPAARAFRAFEEERYDELESYLERLLPPEGSPAAIKTCVDWNGHLIKTRPDRAEYVPPAYSGIATYDEAGFKAHIDRVFAAAASCGLDAVDRSLLCLWFRQCFRKAWQHTYRFNRLRLTQEAFTRAAEAAWADRPDRDGALVRLTLDHLALLRAEINAEDQLHTGSLPLQRAAIEAVLDACRAVAAAAEPLAPPEGRRRGRGAPPDLTARIAAHIREQTRTRVRYNHALLASNRGVQAATEGRWSDVSAAIRTVDAAARSTPADSFTELSEIGALQQALERFREHRRVPWLRIDRARIAYLYPFGATGIDYRDIVERLRDAVAGPDAAAGPDRLRPVGLSEHFTAHSDIWHPHSRQGQRFDGVELRLPPVAITVGDAVETLQVSVRFTSLGMHCLRLERPVRDLLPHDLNAVLLRGLREHGTVAVASPGTDRTWKRLSRFARTVLNVDLPEHLEPGRPKRLVIHRGRPHVLLRIQHASEYRPGREDRARPVRDGERLLELFGASGLLNAAPATKESIGDWSRLSGLRHKVIRGLRNEGDLLISTENSTVVASLDTPSNLSAELEALADFTVCIGGALGAWNQQLDDYQTANAKIRDDYDYYSKSYRPHLLRQLQTQRALLTRFQDETRRVIAVLYSPNLLRSSAHAAILLRLLENSGIDRQVQAFRARLAEVVADQTEADMQRWEADRKHHSREAITISLSALGFCTAFQIWQAANVGSDRLWTLLTLAVVIAAVGSMFRRYLWPSARMRRRPGPDDLPAGPAALAAR
ncbi:hypothetical protein LO763_00040 [Glycomyces sp. A-F 0318]|uniref:hypothetical protein n=1 Tax=Glycomyces amatae TaxID=2881355 RepID=UPI001E29C8EF|nr:hypothetical protein [Glycomyces amatae]MCD0442017.1 hypothetical protein [Glycomyces amatae]